MEKSRSTPLPQGPVPTSLRGVLGAAARRVWAKHDEGAQKWLPLWRHMDDSAAVAGMLWDQWVPRAVRDMVAGALPGGAADGRRLTVWLAGTHDVGKATPAFQCQVESLAETVRDAGLGMRDRSQFGQDRRLAPHGLAGQQLLADWLVEHHGWNRMTVHQFTIMAGGHHGVPPDHPQMHDLMVRPELLRTPGPAEPRWRAVQTEFLDACAQAYGVTDRLEAWRPVRLPQQVQVLLSGLVILADWIASNPDLFPYSPEEHPRPHEERVRAAWEGLRLPPPWSAEEPPGDIDALFATRFALPEGATARPVQRDAVELARGMPASGLLIVEAPMGEGKTEAALAAAEILAARTGAGGVYFALPTMATGNAMFGRLTTWLNRLPSTPETDEHSVLLAHAKAALQEDYALLMRQSHRRIAAVDDFTDDRMAETAETAGTAGTAGAGAPQRKSTAPASASAPAPAVLVAHQWLRGRKKALLASFGAGTIDQLLMMGLKSRHLVLRHLALAGKVVVIDEVHAYDAYMNTYLDRVLGWLGAYGVPVVLLSATLPAARRRELTEAYTGEPAPALDTEHGYPLLIAGAPGTPPRTATPAPSGRGHQVAVERMDDDPGHLADRLAAELIDGGCALVVRNTVQRVHDTAQVLRARFGADAVTVAHAQYVDLDRARKDRDLIDRFGPPKDATNPEDTNPEAAAAEATDAEATNPGATNADSTGTPPGRPHGPHIVVASQVAEQSLDVDFDILVSDLCPVDLLLQRMGRLHRHPRPDRPARLRTPRCLVTGVLDWAADATAPPPPVSGSVSVYREHALYRSLAVLAPHLDGRPLRLPEDISPLVQRAYGPEDPCPPAWAEHVERARKKEEQHRSGQHTKAAVFRLGGVQAPGRPLIGWVEAGVGDADDAPGGHAKVRDGQESPEVLVVTRRSDGTLTTLPWLDGGLGGLDLPTGTVPEPRAARAAAASALRLPYRYSFPGTFDRAVKELEQNYFDAWQAKESHWLAGQLILVLDESGHTTLLDRELRYDPEEGLRDITGSRGTPPPAPGTPLAPENDGPHPMPRTSTSTSTSTSTHRTTEAPSPAGKSGKTPTPESGKTPAPKSGMGPAPAPEPTQTPAPEPPPSTPTPTFNLTQRPWIRAQFTDGTERELSLHDVFEQCREIRRLSGDLPTQDFALLRLLLAVAHDALNGPKDIFEWAELWSAEAPFTPVGPYLTKHADRFDLLHPETPFFQVAELRTAKDEISSLNRLVADVPNNDPFFTMRLPGTDRLTYAEAARWLVHAHAYDPSGIKSGPLGDDRVKSGKGYPQGTAWAGALGGVTLEGGTLHETLLLNLIAEDTGTLEYEHRDQDRPAWRARHPAAPGPAPDLDRRPYGLRDLYTWQSRRVRLHHDADGVHGVLLAYGDALPALNKHRQEPMTGWRHSEPQRKKHGVNPAYLPREHDPARSAWRGIGGLIANEHQGTAQHGEAAVRLRPRVMDWVARLIVDGALPPDHLVRARLTGARYGTQQSVIDEVVDDGVLMPVVLLHEGNRKFARAAVNALDDAEQAVRILGGLATDLATASGADPEPRRDTALDLGYGTLDAPFRDWLRDLTPVHDPVTHRDRWKRQLHRLMRDLGRSLLADTGLAAWEGRVVPARKGGGTEWLNDARAEQRFHRALTRLLTTPDEPPGDDPGNGNAPGNGHEPDPGTPAPDAPHPAPQEVRA